MYGIYRIVANFQGAFSWFSRCGLQIQKLSMLIFSHHAGYNDQPFPKIVLAKWFRSSIHKNIVPQNFATIRYATQ